MSATKSQQGNEDAVSVGRSSVENGLVDGDTNDDCNNSTFSDGDSKVADSQDGSSSNAGESEDENEVYYPDDENTPNSEKITFLKERVLPYPCKWLFRHASHSTSEIAEDLSKEGEFWEKDSRVRQRWLTVYQDIKDELPYCDEDTFKDWNRFHVAAAVGYRQLLSCLIEESGDGAVEALSQRADDYTPVSFQQQHISMY